MMASTIPAKEQENQPMDPKKFNLWLAIIATTMLFAAWTSAYIVKKADGNWDSFIIPEQFIYSTIIVVLSSVTMQWAHFAAKRDNLYQVKIASLSTLILGVGFGISQFLGWQVLVANKIFFSDGENVAGSFFYVITVFHFLHVAGGWLALGRVTYKAFKLEIHRKSMRAMSLCTTYWHFMGILWIYLYLFLFLNR